MTFVNQAPISFLDLGIGCGFVDAERCIGRVNAIHISIAGCRATKTALRSQHGLELGQFDSANIEFGTDRPDERPFLLMQCRLG